MTTTKTLDIPAGQSFFGVRFHPGMAASFLPEAARLNDKIEPLENVISRPARVILEELCKAAGPLEMVAALEEFLRPLDPSDAAEKALQYMAHIQGPLDNLAADAGLSTRHLRRICLDRAGVSPKYLARILRFRRAAERMAAMTRRRAQPKWADFAVACGYYDQAHFIREFQEFTGSTPGRYLQSLTQRLPYNSVA